MVTSQTTLKILAEELDTRDFMAKFDQPVLPVLCSDDGTALGTAAQSRQILFSRVAQPLLLAAATKFDAVNFLLANSPSELLTALPDSVTSLLNSLPVVPDPLIPWIAEIAARSDPGIFALVKDERAVIIALKLFATANPDRVRAVSLFVCSRPALWGALAAAMDDLPLIGADLRRFVPDLCRMDSARALPLVGALPLTDYWARVAIAHVQQYLPAQFDVFCKLARAGELAFRSAAVYASAEPELWAEFCRRLRGTGDHLVPLLSHIEDYAKARNTTTALNLIYGVASLYAVGSRALLARMAPFAYSVFEWIHPHNCGNVLACVKIMCFVHPYAEFVRPIIGGEIDRFEPRVADLAFKYLWAARTDGSPDFLIFRLKLLMQRRRRGQTPRFWTEEMLQGK
jgi:hypothetical protein